MQNPEGRKKDPWEIERLFYSFRCSSIKPLFSLFFHYFRYVPFVCVCVWVCVCMCVCLSVCVCVKERGRKHWKKSRSRLLFLTSLTVKGSRKLLTSWWLKIKHVASPSKTQYFNNFWTSTTCPPYFGLKAHCNIDVYEWIYSF